MPLTTGKVGLVVALLLACVAKPSGAQTNGITNLVVQVKQEAHLDPQRITLSFRVSANGESDVTSQTTNVAAWVRALPGQRIRVVARFISLDGPDGPVPITAVRWEGSEARATAGGQDASCSSGTSEPGVTQDLVLRWQRSGTLTCAVKLALTAPRSLSAGLYGGTVNLALDAQ